MSEQERLYLKAVSIVASDWYLSTCVPRDAVVMMYEHLIVKEGVTPVNPIDVERDLIKKQKIEVRDYEHYTCVLKL